MAQQTNALDGLRAAFDKEHAFHAERGDAAAAERVAAERAFVERRAAEGWRPPEPDSPEALQHAVALACSFEPSTEITATFASPAFAHSPNTSPNKPASASSWRSTNRATVA